MQEFFFWTISQFVRTCFYLYHFNFIGCLRRDTIISLCWTYKLCYISTKFQCGTTDHPFIAETASYEANSSFSPSYLADLTRDIAKLHRIVEAPSSCASLSLTNTYYIHVYITEAPFGNAYFKQKNCLK